MKIISHRGNLNGIDRNTENNPSHISEVIKRFDVEVDVWFIDSKWYLGHDKPQYEVSSDFFCEKMWIHCKNLDACVKLSDSNLNWFWHENDKMTLTSKGIKWLYPNIYIAGGITVEFDYNKNLPSYIMGICTDYPERYNE